MVVGGEATIRGNCRARARAIATKAPSKAQAIPWKQPVVGRGRKETNAICLLRFEALEQGQGRVVARPLPANDSYGGSAWGPTSLLGRRVPTCSDSLIGTRFARLVGRTRDPCTSQMCHFERLAREIRGQCTLRARLFASLAGRYHCETRRCRLFQYIALDRDLWFCLLNQQTTRNSCQVLAMLQVAPLAQESRMPRKSLAGVRRTDCPEVSRQSVKVSGCHGGEGSFDPPPWGHIWNLRATHQAPSPPRTAAIPGIAQTLLVHRGYASVLANGRFHRPQKGGSRLPPLLWAVKRGKSKQELDSVIGTGGSGLGDGEGPVHGVGRAEQCDHPEDLGMAASHEGHCTTTAY